MLDDQNHTGYQKDTRKSLNPGRISKKQHTPDTETINMGDKENLANADDKKKQGQNVSTRKRKRRVRIKIKNDE